MANNISGRVAIVGVAESDQIGIVPDKSVLQLHAEAAHNALTEAGLSIKDVDAIFTAGTSPMETAEYLGVIPKYFDGTSVGGSSFVIHAGHAATAIANGLCSVALITHGESGRSRVGAGGFPQSPQNLRGQFEAPYGLPLPVGAYAMACSRHMALYGTTNEQLAEIAVATRKWAMMNPKAMYRDPLTIQDVLNTRWVAWPFHLLDCCLVTDAGGAVVLTSIKRARDLKTHPVAVLGFGESIDHSLISQMHDFTSGPAVVSGKRAFEMAGVSRDDIDLAMIYDSFTYTVLMTLEDLGFCKKGEGGAFVAQQRTAPGGNFPLNTNGGGLSYTHPGMYGVFTLIEATRQLRHDYKNEAARQVKDAKIAIAHGTVGVLSSAGTAILARS
ncbi:MAG: thiolase [Chloroflexi bacterium]|nr:thiolase [Chloroflexota bacterium]